MKHYLILLLCLLSCYSFAQNTANNNFSDNLAKFNFEYKNDDETIKFLNNLIIDNASKGDYWCRYLTNDSVYAVLISGLLPDNSKNIQDYCLTQLTIFSHSYFLQKFSLEINDMINMYDIKRLKQLLPIFVYAKLELKSKNKLLSLDSIPLFEKAMLGDYESQNQLIENFENEKDFSTKLFLAKLVGTLGTKEALKCLIKEFTNDKVYEIFQGYVDFYSSKYIAIKGFQFYNLTPLFFDLEKICSDFLIYKNQYSEVDFNCDNAIKQREYLSKVIEYIKKEYHFKCNFQKDDFLEYIEEREIDYEEYN